MLDKQRLATSNFLLHNNEDAKRDREQIYVPLALVERRKPDKKESEYSPEVGSKLYEPQYEEKQRFEHQAWLEQILEKGESKTKGKRIALIGEPGAGKTTTLQDIAFWVLEKELGLPIWIPLADLVRNENLIDLPTYLCDTWLNLAVSPSQKDIAQQELETQIEQERVWLLLDGVDEVATSELQILQHLAQQLTGWLGKSRVMLTCRLNVWQADLNFLSDFETYRLLDFDYPQQVHHFIHNWFSNKDVSKGERLKTELANPDKARLRDLIQNPLRLTLLCNSWQSNEAKLPDTKAELYDEFVRQFYNWKRDRFSVNTRQQEELNLALEGLALKDIQESNSRFRLRESFISQELGYPDEKNSLFYLALQLGWLNNVGIAAESSTKERVYGFFHPTFQEYFAACATDDWDFFLSREHGDKPLEDKEYRIFEPKWKEVILLWLGREDIAKEEKEEFITALVDFEDGYSPVKSSIDRGFYQYRAYFLAAAGINEFKEYSRSKEIVAQVINWAFGELIWDITSSAKTALIETNRTGAIEGLIRLIDSTTDESTRRQAAASLGTIDPGNPKAIEGLIRVIESNTDESTLLQAVASLGEILTKSLMPKAISILKDSQQQEAVKVLWDCAQNLSYPEFYQAWNHLQIFVTSIEQELIELTKPVQLIYINCRQFSNSYNAVVSSYEQILAHNFPPSLHGLPYTIEKFKNYWYSLQRNSDKKLVLLFYDPLNKLSPAFFAACSKFDGKICIVSNSATPDLQHFSLSQDNLSEAIIDWIENQD